VEALEARQNLTRLRERLAAQREPVEAIEIEPKALFERAQGAEMHRKQDLGRSAAAPADGSSVGNVKAGGRITRNRFAAARAAAQLRPEAQRVECAQLDEDPQTLIRCPRLDRLERRASELEYRPRLATGAPFGRQAVQEFDDVAAECEASRMRAADG
jgi:hypothetical protein